MPILVAVRDLLFRSKIQAAAERLGVAVRFAPRGAPLVEAARELGEGTVLADLGEPGALEQIRAARAAARIRVVGFLGHLEADLARAAAEAGVDEVLTRGQLVQRLDDVLTSAAAQPSGAPGGQRS
jgi:CheY-like chemotaxis protein